MVCDPILISSEKPRTVERTACESTVIRGSVSKGILITPFERASASTSSSFRLIDCGILRGCYFCDYSISTLILLLFCSLTNATYYLKESKHIYSPLNVFTRLNSEISYKVSIKTFFVANFCFLSYSIKQEPLEKQNLDTLLSDQLKIERSGIYFAKKTPPPSSHNFTCVHWG